MVHLTGSLFLLACAALAVANVTVQNSCPATALDLIGNDKYFKIQGQKCFLFVPYDKIVFEKARNKCTSSGGTLAMPKTKAVNDFLIQEMKSLDNTDSPLWIGMHDTVEEGKMVWEDGTDVKDWGNFDRGNGGLFGGGEDCIALDPGNKKWHDYGCFNTGGFFNLRRNSKLGFICEYQIVKGSSGNGGQAGGDDAGKGTQTIDDTAGKGTQTIDDTAGKGTQTIDDTAGKGTQTIDDTAGKGTQTIDDTAGKGTQTIDDTAGKGTQTIDDTAGKGTQTIDDTAGKGTQTIDDTAGKGTQTIDDTAGKGTQTIDDTAGKGTQTIDDTTGKGTQTIDDTAGKGTQTIDDTAGKGTQTIDDTAGKGTQTIDDTAGKGTQTIDDTAGKGTQTIDDTAGKGTQTIDDASGTGTQTIDGDQKGDDDLDKKVDKDDSCKPFDCQTLDCGMRGFVKENGCQLCKCNDR